MNLYEVYLSLSALYANSLLDNSPFFDNVVGDLRISVTHKQASILSGSDRTCVMMLLDVSEYGKTVENKILFSDRHGSTSTSVEIGNCPTENFQFIADVPKYLPPGTILEYPTWNLNDITEEFIFQKSTMYNLLEYKYFDQIKPYFHNINRLNVEAKISCMMHLDFDWHNIPLQEKDFI